jgi:Tol biopolymer transport system component
MLRTRLAPVVATSLATLLIATAAQAGPPNSTVMLTRPAGFGPLTAPLVNDSFSGQFNLIARASIGFYANRGRRLTGGPSNGSRYTVFVSRSDGLIDDDNNSVDNIYVRDAVNNTTTLVSRATDGTAANGDSHDPAISSNGQFVVFASRATNLVPNIDTNGTQQIYERDLQNNTTKLVSRADGAAGVVANGDSYEPSVSTDGATVAFASIASNLPGASDHEQIYVRQNASTLIVSVPGGTSTPGSSNSYGPSLSDDGKVVAFTSDSSDLTASDNNGSSDVFIHRLLTGATLLASVETIAPTPGAYGNDGSAGASISSDGSRVAFSSAATNLSTLDANGDSDVYLHDFGTNATGLVSQGGGNKANAASYDASISASGQKIAFTTAASNLYSGDTNGVPDVYVNDTGFLGGTSLASRCQNAALLTQGADEGAIAPAGNVVSFTTLSRGCTPQAEDDFNQVYTRALGIVIAGTEPTTWISRPTGTGDFKSGTSDSAAHGSSRGGSSHSALSADGDVAAFVSESDELSPDDDNAVSNVYVRENKTGVTELISRASGANGAAGDGASGPRLHLRGQPLGPPSISADGRYVAFTSAADNLVFGDANNHVDVFVRDRATNTTTLVSVKSDGTQVNADSYDADISADGTRVAFASDGILDPADSTATKTSVYVHDMTTGTTTLVSRQSDPGTFDANEAAVAPSISGDGTHVAFLTKASNLAPSLIDNNGKPDVYVRDLAAKQTRLGSARNGLSTAGDDGAVAGDLDFTGTHLAFASDSTNIAGADGNGVDDIFVRDLTGTTTTLISHGPGSAAGSGPSDNPSISSDGTRIAFDTGASDLLLGDTNSSREVLVRDLTAGTLTLVSRADGAAGATANELAASPSISPNGHCVAFDSFADNLVPGEPAGTDFLHGYMRALDADCGTPPPPPQPQPGPAPDTVAPLISALKTSPGTFRIGTKATAISANKKAPRGTKIKFTLSEAASVSLRIDLKAKGRKKGAKCVAKRRTGRRCTRYVHKLTLKRSGKQGANSVAFSGRFGKKKLAKGTYRITATATDAAHNVSKKKTATFKVVAG